MDRLSKIVCKTVMWANLFKISVTNFPTNHWEINILDCCGCGNSVGKASWVKVLQKKCYWADGSWIPGCGIGVREKILAKPFVRVWGKTLECRNKCTYYWARSKNIIRRTQLVNPIWSAKISSHLMWGTLTGCYSSQKAAFLLLRGFCLVLPTVVCILNFFLSPTTANAVTETIDLTHRPVLGPLAF